MVGLLVRLRLRLWSRALTRSTPLLISAVVGGLLALLALALLLPGLVALRSQPLPLAAVVVPALASITLLWSVLSVGAFGVDHSLDPARFALLPLRARELLPGLLAAAYTGIPGILLLGLAAGQVLTWSRSPLGVAAGLYAAVTGALTAVLLSRVLTSALARVMRTPLGRAVGALISTLVTFVPVLVNLVVLGGRPEDLLRTVDGVPWAHRIGWTPFGWAWAVPFDVAEGALGRAAVHAVLAALLVVGLVLAWHRLLATALVSPAVHGPGVRVRGRAVLPRVLGTSPAAAVATRRLRSWRRDSRLVSMGVRLFLLPGLLLLQGLVLPDNPTSGTMATMFIAVTAGLSLMNDLAFDGPTWWMHVASGARGRDDRLGRVLAAAVVFAPVVALTYVGARLMGIVPTSAAFGAVLLAMFLCSLGVAAFVGAYLPGNAPRAGNNPFAAQSGGGAQGCLMAIISFLAPVLVAAPLVAALLLTPLRSHPVLAVLAALVWGSCALAVGVVLGGRRLDTHAPEMLALLRRAEV